MGVVAFLVCRSLGLRTRSSGVTITRSGRSKEYAENWALAFGKKSETKTAKAAKKSTATGAKKKTAKAKKK
jgi:hypothetical protein